MKHAAHPKCTVPQIVLPPKYLGNVEGPAPEGSERQYLGQPDMILLDDGTLVTAFPAGHGCGPLILKKSTDRGETWEEITDTPESWKLSLETPTMYKLHLTDKTTKYILITGRPAWRHNTGACAVGGWDVSVSSDGVTWSEYTRFQADSGLFSVVAMASLVQLRDTDGRFIDKWMGVFHDSYYNNYKTYLTFDKDGKMHWTAPRRYLAEYDDIEKERQICEAGLFRSPDKARIVALARTQSHIHRSVIFWSDDEGQTWSRPVDAPAALQGERHKVLCDPVSGRLLVAFREITLHYDRHGRLINDGWRAGNWVAWVGTYTDLMEHGERQYRILLARDWTNSLRRGDTGYTGMAVYPDGTFVLDSYGHWDKAFSRRRSKDVTTDRCWIRRARFTLAETDAL